MSEAKSFGELFRELRIGQGKTLRQFCLENGFDVGNTSKLERDELQAPVAPEKLRQYAFALGLTEGGDEWHTFFDVAAVSAGRIPRDVLSEREIVARLPLMLRTLKNKQLDGDRLDKLVELIRRY